jgi:hypothetical protein
MPVEVVWDDEAQTMLRQIYSGHLKLEDYIAVTDEFGRMARSVPHTVHSIMDRTRVLSTPGVLLPAMRYANNTLPPNVGLRVIIKASLLTRVLVDLGRRIAPHLINNIYFVESIEDAHRLIVSQPEKNLAPH